MTEPFRVTHPHRVRQRMAHALLPDLPPTTLGSITLLPHQQSAVARLRRILDEHHGALLADDVGLGKTFVALAVAHGYPRVHVLAPAGLRDMWQRAIARAGPAHAQVHSLHAYSQAHRAALPLAGDTRTLVIIDEAHYLRNPSTTRYCAVAHAVAGCDVLLLSATPLHNRANELRTLFALFRGDRADSLAPAQLAALIVRRTTSAITPPPGSHDGAVRAAAAQQRPTVLEHPPIRIPQDRDTLTHILALPAPLPAHDGAVAGALIRLGLLRAWCSSDAALSHALRTRQLRGAALHDALRAGRHPTQQELRSWVVGDHDGQLAFPELLAAQPVESGPLLDILQRHLDALATLARHHARTGHADTERADMLRQLLERHPGTPIVAFSQFTRTIAALQRALADIAGVGTVTSRTGRIASGPLPRADVLASFAPVAHGRPPPPPHQRIRLLLATDLIAEGVNLQDAGVVVHIDLPWTHALRTQRVGRCARLGSPHTSVHVYRLAPADFAARALQLEHRLARKRALTRTVVGASHVGQPARSAAEQATAWHERLSAWRDSAATRPFGDDEDHDDPRNEQSPCPVAVLRHTAPAALLLLASGRRPRLVALRRHGTRWRLHTGHGAVLSLMRAVDSALARHAVVPAAIAREQWRIHRVGIRRALQRWWRQERVAAISGRAHHTATDTQQACVRVLQRQIRALATADRRLMQDDLAATRRCIESAVGAGYEANLTRWCAQASTHPDATAVREWLSQWRQDPLLARLTGRSDRASVPAGRSRREPETVRAVLLLVPD